MRSLIKWSPISEFHDVTNQLSNLMNFGQRPYLNDDGQVNEELDWTPAVNVTENDLRYKIQLYEDPSGNHGWWFSARLK